MKKFCYNCSLATAGDEPRFCNFCGRSYDVKICPRGHMNTRTAKACSRCGSRDLSTPQPRRPLWAPVLQILLSALPMPFLVLASLDALVAVLVALSAPGISFSLIAPLALVGGLWWAWAQIPRWFREAMYRFLRSLPDDES